MSRKSPPNKKSLLGNTSLQVELRAASASASSFVQTGVVFTFLRERSGWIVGHSDKGEPKSQRDQPPGSGYGLVKDDFCMSRQGLTGRPGAIFLEGHLIESDTTQGPNAVFAR